jgi:hypothetical protein
MITISIQGVGNFEIPNEKLQELLNWLAINRSVKIQNENNYDIKYNGKELIQG